MQKERIRKQLCGCKIIETAGNTLELILPSNSRDTIMANTNRFGMVTTNKISQSASKLVEHKNVQRL